MSIYCPKSPPEFTAVLSRIRQKKEDYERYGFNQNQGRTLRAFFDLAQELETLENFYRICVFVPKEFMGFDSCLYLLDEDSQELTVACDSLSGLSICGVKPPEGIHLSPEPYTMGDSRVYPIRGNRRLFHRHALGTQDEIIGVFEVFPRSHFEDNDDLFFEKYANRIGYNLHYKLIYIQNVEHIKFINNLAADIEHNVIVPNMKYKVFLNGIKKKLKKLEELSKAYEPHIQNCLENGCNGSAEIARLHHEVETFIRDLEVIYADLEKHFENTSLFLESLMRREHFEKGELVIRKRMCRFVKEIIEPQLERYIQRFHRAGIRIDNRLGGVRDENIPLAVDVGLISQVYANLFSNVEKYCSAVPDDSDNMVKFVAFGEEILPNYFPDGSDGIKFNVFSTGKHIPPEEADLIFEEGFRSRETAGTSPGTGHGLHFVRKVIEVHGGVVGYEPVKMGNNFYFILPLQRELEKKEWQGSV